jgi:hypothetical protein
VSARIPFVSEADKAGSMSKTYSTKSTDQIARVREAEVDGNTIIDKRYVVPLP